MARKVENKVELDQKLLRKIADYYEFPMAAFFLETKHFKGTRKECLRKKVAKFKQELIKLIDEFLEEI
ncbi:TPA: hypothetical protein EYP70_04145 [Candidatus Bathyarchaeota archaeon]|nr:hypothetical protein [Candidatus Bathyarchaeota archaeon]